MIALRDVIKIMIALMLVACATQGVKADLFNGGVGITDPASYDQPQANLYVLFNTYFGLEEGMDGYVTSSNELFEARGVAGVAEWTASEGAYVYGVNRIADLDHNLTFKFNNGTTLSTGWLVAKTEPTEFSELGDVRDLDPGPFTMTLATYYRPFDLYVGIVEANSIKYNNGVEDDLVHMIALDVTDLMQAKLGVDKVQSAYMFCWEDLVLGPTGGWGDPADWDFQDLVYILVNVYDARQLTLTPEPATALILLAGLAVCPLVRRQRSK